MLMACIKLLNLTMNQEAVVKGYFEHIEGRDVFSVHPHAVKSHFLNRRQKFNKSTAGTALYPATAP